MRRIVQRLLPDGSVRKVQPFHVCMEGRKTAVLCRDDEDYDAMVKIICLCARRKNVIIIIYSVVSNHCHVGVLAVSQEEADGFGSEVKRMYSMWFSRRYSKSEILKDADIKAIALDNDWYVRNALAYIPRNALDNGCNVDTYPWSGYRAMFRGDSEELSKGRPVALLSKRECRAIFHTGDSLKDVSWLVDSYGHLIPSSFCDTSYLEQVYEGEQAYFLKTIEVSLRYYKTDLSKISITQKYRLLPYIRRTMHTTVPQLARTFGLTRDQVAAALGARSPKSLETLPSEMPIKGSEGQ